MTKRTIGKRTIGIKAEVKVNDAPRVTKEWLALDVMKTGQVRSWLTREFNKALKAAGEDQIVIGRFSGQLKRAPYTSYVGSLSGVNGRVMARRGLMED